MKAINHEGSSAMRMKKTHLLDLEPVRDLFKPGMTDFTKAANGGFYPPIAASRPLVASTTSARDRQHTICPKYLPRAMLPFIGLTLIVLIVLYGLVCLVYWLLQDRFVFVRFRLPRAYVFPFRQAFKEVWLTAEDGAELHALHFTVPAAKGTILYFHGNTGSLRRWGKAAPMFLQHGWSVLMMDYRGFGKSRGKLDEPTLHADAQRWYEHLHSIEPEHRIIVYGRSLGSGFAVPVAAAHRPKALVLESPFANLYDPARHQFFLLPYRLLLRFPFRNDKAILRVQCPVTIFQGRRDPVVPYESALRLYSLIPSHVAREMVTLPRGFHSDLARFTRFQRKLGLLLR